METIPSKIFNAMMQYLRGGGMNAIIPAGIQAELPKILNKNLYGDGSIKPKATHSAWLSEDTALKALHNCGFWGDGQSSKTWEASPRNPEQGEIDVIKQVILEMRRAKTHARSDGQHRHNETADDWWKAKEAHSLNWIEEEQIERFKKIDLELDRKAGIETLVALSEAELDQAIIEGRRRYKARED